MRSEKGVGLIFNGWTAAKRDSSLLATHSSLPTPRFGKPLVIRNSRVIVSA